MPLVVDNLNATQAARLRRFGVPAAVDLHCHCLPALDDGPQSDEQALDLCRLLAQDGTTTVIATPHALGRYEGRNRPPEIRSAVARLNALLGRHAVPLVVLPGAEVRADARLAERLQADEILTVPDGGRYLLLELPGEISLPPEKVVAQLAARGIVTVLSHPERNRLLSGAAPAELKRWLDAGAIFQVTAASLLGECGRRAAAAAWEWLGRGLVALVASDAHDTNHRRPRMTAAIEAIAQRFGETAAGDVCVRNPLELVLLGRGTGKPAPAPAPAPARAPVAAGAGGAGGAAAR